MKRMVLAAVLACGVMTAGLPKVSAEDAPWKTYYDQQERFKFSYPESFGETSADIREDMPGADTGETIHFSRFSYGGMNGGKVQEGDLVIRKGRVWVSAQALGGLYDPVMLGSMIQVFPVSLQEKLRQEAETLSVSNFCERLSAYDHISAHDPSLSRLDPQRKQAVLDMDHAMKKDIRVARCEVDGDTVVFHKEVVASVGAFEFRQHIYGAVRFLSGAFSSVQLIRITLEAPKDQVLEDMRKVVQSFQER